MLVNHSTHAPSAPITQGKIISAESPCHSSFHSFTKKVFKMGRGVIEETIKIVVSVIFLDLMNAHFFSHLPKSSFQKKKVSHVAIPLAEEVLFRGALMNCFYLLQKGLQRYGMIQKGIQANRKYEWVRLHATALIFATIHLANPHPTKIAALTQVLWSYLGGVVYGRLAIKTQSLAPGILAHGMNNFIVDTFSLHKSNVLTFTLLIVNRAVFYYLGSNPSKNQDQDSPHLH